MRPNDLDPPKRKLLTVADSSVDPAIADWIKSRPSYFPNGNCDSDEDIFATTPGPQPSPAIERGLVSLHILNREHALSLRWRLRVFSFLDFSDLFRRQEILR